MEGTTMHCEHLEVGWCGGCARALLDENRRLRMVVSRVATAIGNGSACSQEASIGFMEVIPDEVALVVDRLRREIEVMRDRIRMASEPPAVQTAVTYLFYDPDTTTPAEPATDLREGEAIGCCDFCPASGVPVHDVGRMGYRMDGFSACREREEEVAQRKRMREGHA